jgi:cytidine deaminase
MSFDDLVKRALAARASSYSPYSNFAVGAAVQTSDGRVFVGSNVENASYGVSVCAERVAILAAVNAGARLLKAVAVATATTPPAAPCGVCRQTMAEFGEDAMPVVLVNDRGERRDTTLAELFPYSFRRHDLVASPDKSK